ncbi:hypothetical protein ACKWTF_001757 [Chironomus riparius]
MTICAWKFFGRIAREFDESLDLPHSIPIILIRFWMSTSLFCQSTIRSILPFLNLLLANFNLRPNIDDSLMSLLSSKLIVLRIMKPKEIPEEKSLKSSSWISMIADLYSMLVGLIKELRSRETTSGHRRRCK